MGWIYNGAYDTPMDLIKAYHPNCTFHATSRKGNVIYVAMSRERKPDMVFAMVFLTGIHDGAPGYKDMDETMGPFYHDASKKVLDALTPTDDATALSWRANCRARLANPPVKLKAGMRVSFDPPIKFVNGMLLKEATVEEPRRRTFRGDDYRLYKLDNFTYGNAIRDGRIKLA